MYAVVHSTVNADINFAYCTYTIPYAFGLVNINSDYLLNYRVIIADKQRKVEQTGWK